jgi:hypothetical protein
MVCAFTTVGLVIVTLPVGTVILRVEPVQKPSPVIVMLYFVPVVHGVGEIL